MCGRFANSQPAETTRKLFRAVNSVPEDARPSWNIAPSQPALVIRRHPETGNRHIDLLIWGLVPHWTRDFKAARRPINARAETVTSAPMFRSAFASRRCLVPVDAWYEWQVTPTGRQPFAFARPDRETTAFAGLWESWVTPGTAKLLRTFTIITTSANATAAPVHERMPVIIDRGDWPIWLGETAGEPAALLRPGPVRLSGTVYCHKAGFAACGSFRQRWMVAGWTLKVLATWLMDWPSRTRERASTF